MNYPPGSNTSSAPWNQADPDEPKHQRFCKRCRHFLRVYNWTLEDDGGYRQPEWVWFTVCNSCGAINIHDPVLAAGLRQKGKAG